MKCTNHPKEDASATCVGCGDFFCNECLTKVKGKNYCKSCMAELIESNSEKAKEEKVKEQPQIIVHQQQEQHQVSSGTNWTKLCLGCCCMIIIFYMLLWFLAAISANAY